MRLTRRSLLLVSTLGLLAPAPRGVRAAAMYEPVDIGWLVGSGNAKFDALTKVAACEISNDGVIVANSTPADLGNFYAVPFTSIDGEVKRLGSQGEFTFVVAMNNAGDVVGYSTSLDDKNYQQTVPTVWRKRKQIALPRLSDGGAFAAGINDDGAIVGNAYTEPGGPQHAVIWEKDEIRDLGTLGGPISLASDINTSGVVVGSSEATDRTGNFPAVWTGDEIAEIELPEGMNGTAAGINGAGAIHGYMYGESRKLFGFTWIDDQLAPLPSLLEGGATFPIDVNANGEIVGWSEIAKGDSSTYVAALWSGGTVTDLNELIPPDTGYTLISGQTINDKGQIVATGVAADGSQHGILLNPGG